uniref:Uncharacterized protein n=1 Tax=viral metagenome TaxID=1070528 RepID=A0A6M3JA51_9ZZZZ
MNRPNILYETDVTKVEVVSAPKGRCDVALIIASKTGRPVKVEEVCEDWLRNVFHVKYRIPVEVTDA